MEYRSVTLMTALDRPIGTLSAGQYVQCRPDKETVVLIEPNGRRRYLDAGQYGSADIADGGKSDYKAENQDIQNWLRDNSNAKACKGLDGYSLETDQEDSVS